MKTSITLEEIKKLNEEDFITLCLTHAHEWQWENKDAYMWALAEVA